MSKLLHFKFCIHGVNSLRSRTACTTAFPALSWKPLELKPSSFSVEPAPAASQSSLSSLTTLPRRLFCSSSLEVIPNVDYIQLVDILKNKTATVIDVRNPEELTDYGAIPGAVNIPLGDLEVNIA